MCVLIFEVLLNSVQELEFIGINSQRDVMNASLIFYLAIYLLGTPLIFNFELFHVVKIDRKDGFEAFAGLPWTVWESSSGMSASVIDALTPLILHNWGLQSVTCYICNSVLLVSGDVSLFLIDSWHRQLTD